MTHSDFTDEEAFSRPIRAIHDYPVIHSLFRMRLRQAMESAVKEVLG